MQTRLGSFCEAVINLLVGMLVNIAGQYVIYPVLGLEVGHGQILLITLFFTFVSLARQYVLRRVFNHFIVRRNR